MRVCRDILHAAESLLCMPLHLLACATIRHRLVIGRFANRLLNLAGYLVELSPSLILCS
jgi:hypothetical protein